jgi:hypothetical protein
MTFDDRCLPSVVATASHSIFHGEHFRIKVQVTLGIVFKLRQARLVEVRINLLG